MANAPGDRKFLITCTNCQNEYFGLSFSSCPKCGSRYKNYPQNESDREYEEEDEE